MASLCSSGVKLLATLVACVFAAHRWNISSQIGTGFPGSHFPRASIPDAPMGAKSSPHSEQMYLVPFLFAFGLCMFSSP